MARLRPYRRDLWAWMALFGLALLWFGPVLLPAVSGVTLLPYDNLAGFEPWRSMHPGLVPHNELLSDLILENAVWKLHIRRTLADGQLPLWNPQILTGLPFFAAGQASTFYPLSLLFYLLPLEAAYGWFTALQIGLAGANMYVLARTLRLGRWAAFFSGLVYMFSGFLIVSVVFTMFVAAVAWLPLLLAVIEIIVHKQEQKGVAGYSPIPYVVAGAVAVGFVVLAGHPELIYYTLLVAGLYTLVRLGVAWRWVRHGPAFPPAAGTRWLRRLFRLALWLLSLAILGVGLGAVQLIPLVELLPLNFREGSATFAQVVGWAWPTRHVLTFFLPNVFGNPSHHAWFDIWRWTWVPATTNALGEETHTIFWGIKNYVEGGNYLGVVTWLLAAVALLHAGMGRRRADSLEQPRPFVTWFFAALALLSLLFAFGTPLYALLFYGLPGWNQLHSPFRWVFPFTLSMALLGGVGLQHLLDGGRLTLVGRPWPIRISAWLSLAAALVGLGTLLTVAVSVAMPGPFVALGERVLAASDLARMAFADGRMFWSYQSMNLIHFGVFSLLSGAVLWILTRPHSSHHRLLRSPHLALLLVLIVFLDLYVAHGRFNPATDVALSPLAPGNRPPVVDFIEQREAERAAQEGVPATYWRFTTFNLPGEKTFNANVGMYYGWHDIRGYDSIILRQYVAFMERIAPQANELLYNRIAPLYSNVTPDPYAVVDNPLLDLLNVRYILTQHHLPNPGWQEIYRDDAIAVYENTEAMPRAFIAAEARVAPPEEQPLLETDLRRVVFVETTPTESHALVPAGPQVAEARISRYTANDVFVDVNLSDRGWLVLTDAYFPGWKAFLRPFGGDESQEQELTLYRADGAFRAVYLPQAGQWTVRFVYSPMSFKLGLYVSFLAAMALLMLLLYWAWGRYYRPESSEGEVRTVAKNSLVPMMLSLMNKGIDFAFAMLYVRLLGPEGTGKYAFVVAIYGFFEIISRYGLGTLLTRDVAADKNQSSRYLTNVLALRTLLWLASLPLLALVTWGFWVVGRVDFLDASGIGPQEIQAIAIFALSMLFANWADALSSMFYAFEKMEYPAGLTNAVALLKVTLGALVLLLGWGFVGLAAVSLVINVLQLFWLYGLLRSTLFPPEWHWDWPLQKWMFRTSGPLMINHLLATIFWRIDLWILRPLAGAASVGLYSVGLKYLDGLNIVPSVFTMAVFPLMSRYARHNGSNLLRSYVLSLRLLVMVSLPIAMSVTFLAEPLVYLVGGVQYLRVPETITLLGREISFLGGSALALQVIIWSIPIGFVNSVTQYVLIAVDQQRYLTKAFIIGVVFNVVGNLLAIPSFGYLGAAVVTILSEFSLLFPFYYSVKRNVGTVPWLSIFAGPVAAVTVMGGGTAALMAGGLNPWIAVALGWVLYLVVLVGAGVFRHDDMAVLLRALPVGPWRSRLPAA
ncbi:oligosaccharide flippase family protein [Litorilinea aerophila]|uniref:Oligosaccharide flippase family protein n=1 Tax=Litorilinea aerophila TaxID=1204385 RepID=A0A540VM79_9CHLR|nr:oligosaccharide flippase family protein [Litorilinea aerophila]MCC9074569.1 oligosaccharide flippase family protein [Litorilinea aerophila]